MDNSKQCIETWARMNKWWTKNTVPDKPLSLNSNSIKQSLPWEVDNYSASPKGSLPPITGPYLEQYDPVKPLPQYFLQPILILSPNLPRSPLPSIILTNFYAFLFSLMRAAGLAHLISFDLITIIWLYLVKRISTRLLALHPSQVQIFS
jgi:hypothetical protein